MNLPPSSSFLESVPLLLCEGDSDERLLDRIFNTRELKAQQVGTRNIRPAAAYLARQNQPVFTIQDRDFRPLSEAEECYSQNYAERHFMWRRHELENYLIEPRVVANASNSCNHIQKSRCQTQKIRQGIGLRILPEIS